MDQKLDSGTKRYDSRAERKAKRLDLSLPQVAGSALAAIAAAILASQLDVYGTIIGAGVVSVIATCGGSIFHYVFRRTGQQLRDVADQARPRARQVPVRKPRIDTNKPGNVGETGIQRLPEALVVLNGEYGEATTHGTKRRGWKRPVLGATVVFFVAMLCITGYELVSGHNLSDGKGTTIGSVVGGGGGRHKSPTPPKDTDPGGPSGDPRQPGRDPGTGGGVHPTSPGTGGPSDRNGQNGQGTHTPSGTPSPGTSPPGGTPSAPTPTPSPGAGEQDHGPGADNATPGQGAGSAPSGG